MGAREGGPGGVLVARAQKQRTDLARQEMVPYDISRQRIFWAGNRADFGRVNTGQNSLALEGPLHQVRHTSLTFGLHCFQICNELCQKLNHSREN